MREPGELARDSAETMLAVTRGSEIIAEFRGRSRALGRPIKGPAGR
jgi:hypothetical protein